MPDSATSPAGSGVASAPRFATEIVAWVATPWALAGYSPVLAGAAVLLLIGLPAVLVTPGENVKVVVAVPGYVTIALVALQMVAAVVSAWVAWPTLVAVAVSLLVAATVVTERPRWRNLAGGDVMIPRPLHVVNEGLAFVLEILALAALVWWGFETGSGLFVHLLLGIGAPSLAVGVRGMFAAPKARVKLRPAGALTLKALVFGAATVALAAIGHHGLALAFAVIVAANTVIVTMDREAFFLRRTDG